jgi:long-chain acyl-CoA synthetase
MHNFLIVKIIDRPFLGTRRMENGAAKEYEWKTHSQVGVHIENFGKGLKSLGLKRQSRL